MKGLVPDLSPGALATCRANVLVETALCRKWCSDVEQAIAADPVNFDTGALELPPCVLHADAQLHQKVLRRFARFQQEQMAKAGAQVHYIGLEAGRMI